MKFQLNFTHIVTILNNSHPNALYILRHTPCNITESNPIIQQFPISKHLAISFLKEETSGRTRHRKGQPSAVTDWAMIIKRRRNREAQTDHKQETQENRKNGREKTKVNDMQKWYINVCGLENRGVEEKSSVLHERSPAA